MGPWCPNCKDETAYLTELYSKNNANGLEIVALSFDKTTDFETSKNNILKLKTHFNAEYDFLIAGEASKIVAAKVLPMLNQIMSYPTSVFIDRTGKVRKIRTGFYGPGTGNYYNRYTEETTIFVQQLLNEK
jgi:thiol-disulfide isomerase/thioredoxin